MMAKTAKLKKQKVKTATGLSKTHVNTSLEVRFPRNLRVGLNACDYHDQIREDFPLVEIPSPVELVPTTFSTTFSHSDKRIQINCSIEHVVYMSRKNESFQEICKNAINYMDRFTQLYGISKINKFGLRCVIDFEVPPETTSANLGDFVRFGCQHDKFAENQSLQSVDSTLAYDLPDAMVILRIAAPNPATKRSVLLDFDIMAEGTWEPSQIRTQFDSLHKIARSIKDNIVADQAKTEVKI